jgi:hypothetical protein
VRCLREQPRDFTGVGHAAGSGHALILRIRDQRRESASPRR